MKKVNYLKIATEDFLGAGDASVHRVDELVSKGVNAKLLVLEKRTKNPNVIGVYDYHTKFGNFCIKAIRRFRKYYKRIFLKVENPQYHMYDVQLNFITAKRILKLFGDKPDIIDISWVTDFVNYKTVRKLKELTGAKIIYSMYDNAPITGGCHYPWRCRKFETNCFPCPALNSSSQRAKKTLKYKKKYLVSDGIVTYSGQDYNRACNSLLFKGKEVFLVNNIESTTCSSSRNECRSYFNIPEDDFVCIYGASDLNDTRKGYHIFVEMIEKLSKSKIGNKRMTILVVGKCQEKLHSDVNIEYLGNLSFEDLLKAYCCSDVYLCTSLEDSGPMMMKFAINVFLPIVCFPVGYSFDFVKHQVNGYIAEWGNSEDLAKGLLYWYELYCTKGINLYSKIRTIVEECNKSISLDKYLGID